MIVRMIVIASSPRVGSGLISNLLTKAGAGYVTEHFNPSLQIPKTAKENGLKTYEQHFNFLIRNYVSVGGDIFTVKCHFDQFFSYTKKINVFDKFSQIDFVQIKRRSKTNQAISYFISKKTGIWSSKKVAKKDSYKESLIDNIKKIPPDIMYNEIKKMKFRLLQNEAYWDFYLEDIDSTSLYYEDILKREGMNEAKSTFSNLYGREIEIDIDVADSSIQRDNDVITVIKDKIESHKKSLPSFPPMDKCLDFNNGFYGYAKK